METKNSTKAQHSPTPWTKHDNEDYATIYAHDDTPLARVQDFQDASLIVRAVNSHEALVARLEETALYYHKQMHGFSDFQSCNVPLCEENRAALKLARA